MINYNLFGAVLPWATPKSALMVKRHCAYQSSAYRVYVAEYGH